MPIWSDVVTSVFMLVQLFGNGQEYCNRISFSVRPDYLTWNLSNTATDAFSGPYVAQNRPDG